ncbi:MAG: glycosyltransferase [Candidatus Acidiferrales bacterium]
MKVRALARALGRRGHRVTVLTADLGLGSPNRFSIHIERSRWGWRYMEDSVEAIYFPTWARYRALTLNPGVIGFCRASLADFDVVHIYGLYDLLGPLVSHFCGSRGIPYMIEPMGMYRPIDRSFRAKRIWHRTLGRALHRHAARFIATSEMEQQELVADGISAEKVVVRYNGIDADMGANLPPRGTFRAKWNLPPGEPMVFFLSRLIPRKGADILIEAFAQACPQDGRLVIAGPEGESGIRSRLEKLAKDLGIGARVIFTGPIYDQEKKAALADADVFVLPSRYENFANVAAEAMACGVPVILTEFCGIRTLVEGRAGLVAARNTASFAAALRTLLQDRALHSRFQQGCAEVTRELSWDQLSEQMEKLYRSAIANAHEIR